ncbi:MAG: FAD-dependent oxidoreductase [Verrucomicrobiota bacterium]
MGTDEDTVPKVVILGGGPCGLYAARVLAKEGLRVTVVEKEDIPGGLATSHNRGGNFYDLGVHMLHEFDQEIFEDIKELMGGERIEVQLDAKIRWAGSFYRYPLQFADMIRGIPPLELAQMVGGLFLAQIREKVSPWDPANAEEALIQLYGNPLYRFFFKDFTERYWGIPPHELSATFIKSKMPRLSAVDVFKKILSKLGVKEKAGRAVESALLEETLHYSRTGAETMPRRIAAEVERIGGRVLLNCSVSELHVENGRVGSVTFACSKTGKIERIDCDYCISTIPVPKLVESARPRPPKEVQDSCDELRYKPIAVYGLLVKKEKAIDGLYIYYRERIFHRVGEPKNAGLTVNPPDHTVLIVETTCEIDDGKWRGDDGVFERIVSDLEAERICRREDIVEKHLLRAATGYPVFALGFEPHLKRVQRYIDGVDNLFSTGRQGGFCYPNMHSAMRMGANAAGRALDLLKQKNRQGTE